MRVRSFARRPGARVTVMKLRTCRFKFIIISSPICCPDCFWGAKNQCLLRTLVADDVVKVAISYLLCMNAG